MLPSEEIKEKYSVIKSIFLVTLALLPIIGLFEDGPSSILVFSVFVLVYLWKGLQGFFAKLPLPLAPYFIILGSLAGAFTQIMVQLEGLEKTFSADPVVHFFQALTIYFCVIVAWYLVLRKYDFTTWGVFWLTGIWGVAVEAILIYGSFNIFTWLFIFLVYGSFAAIPHLLTKEKFPQDRKKPTKPANLLVLIWLTAALFMAKVLILIMAAGGVK